MNFMPARQYTARQPADFTDPGGVNDDREHALDIAATKQADLLMAHHHRVWAAVSNMPDDKDGKDACGLIADLIVNKLTPKEFRDRVMLAAHDYLFEQERERLDEEWEGVA